MPQAAALQIRKPSRHCYQILIFAGLSFFATIAAAVAPVEFTFRLPASPLNPFARDIWAEVAVPSGKILRLPVFYSGGDGFAVRARANEPGQYRIGKVAEKIGGKETVVAVTMTSAADAKIEKTESLPQVGIDRADHSRFVLAGSGAAYIPIGANLAWASQDGVKYYQRVFPQFGAQGLNWTRIWMAHWDGLNLDWLPRDLGDSPRPGQLDLRVAANWDQIVASAENAGVYVQLVLQHHGQYSSQVNSNWKDNPWNAANPRGFLKEPEDFFTSPAAIDATSIKYRYIVARWGYSPAILAWELFNEVHWVDPINRGRDETSVSQWHSRMADFIRSVDQYGHLLTTSTENLRSPIYERMDYFQPHLYAYALLAGPLAFSTPCETLKRPVFYGETGDDHAPLSNAQKDSGIAIVPPVWASLFGLGHFPAQPWLGEKLGQSNRLGELGAVARFLAATGLGAHRDLEPFSPRIECQEHVPFVLEACQVWQRRAAPDFVLPLDGRVPVESADIPRAYVGSKNGQADGFPGRATYHVDFPKDTALRARVTAVGRKGTTIRISLGEKIIAEKTWAEGAPDTPSAEHPAEFSFAALAGPQTLVVENPGAEDWFQLDAIETDIPIPALAALAKRGENFIAVWLWHRAGVFSVEPKVPVGGTLLLDDVPAGKWTVTWWDTIKGIPASSQPFEHHGGTLRVPVPAINRHAAVVLTR